jgi:hypothetical protein
VALPRELARLIEELGAQMSRTFMLTAGTILWSLVAIDALVHIATGAWTTAALMAAVGVGWVMVRRTQLGLRKAT